jgi:hypothetical protein
MEVGMKKSRFVLLALRAGIVLGLSTVQLFWAMPPAGANTGPPSAILIHVQEYNFYSPCEPQVTDCHQIVRNTAATGQLAFQIFLDPQYHEDTVLNHLTVALTWPDTWYPFAWFVCGGGISNWSWDGVGWVLDVSWPNCPRPGDLFLVGTLLMDVAGPGRLDFEHSDLDGGNAGTIAYWCPPVWWDYWTIGACAVAGTDCEYTQTECGGRERCIARLDETELHLTANVGEVATRGVEFSIMEYGCALGLNSVAPWLSASMVPLENHRFRLDVTADASKLVEGSYQTWVQVVGYPDLAARCLLVTFEVQGTSSVPESPPRETRTWGQIKASFR